MPAARSIPFPPDRPDGLRVSTLRAPIERWRIDSSDPTTWSWDGFATPTNRFDPASGRFRVRYASTTVNGAARERYLNQDRVIRADHADHHLVSLRSNRPLRVVDLRKEVNLDALHVDDGISTSNQPEVRSACSELADALRHWCPDLDGIVYRSRTTPTTSTNFAFFDSSAFEVASTRLGASADALDRLVDEGFTIDFTY